MIYKQSILTINGNNAKLDEDIYLFRLDKNIELYFTIVNNKYKFNKSDLNNIINLTNASYFQMRLYKNAEVKYTFAIQPTDNGKAILTITDDLIDEPIEVGDYDFQISLLDADKSSMISLPIVSKQIHVCEPLVTDASETGTAVLGLSTLESGEIVDAFDEEGNYIRKVHVNGELISAELFNKWEEALETNSSNIKTLDSQFKDIANLKIDNITLSDNVLTFFANSKTIKTITLPTSITGGGTNGKEIELQKSTTHIQWRYVGDTDWTNLVALSDLKGDKGDTGEGVVSGGTTGQILAKKSNTDYDTEWIDAPSTGGSSEKEWITIVDETLKLTEAVSRIKKTVDTDLSSLNEISLYAEISKNTNSDTSDVIFTGINFGGMSFNYFSFAKVTSTTGINIHIKYYLKEPKPYHEKIENVARLAYNVNNVTRQLSVEGSITSNNISISLDKAYMGTIKLQIYGK